MIIKSIDGSTQLNLRLDSLNFYYFEDKEKYKSAMSALNDKRNTNYNYYNSDLEVIDKGQFVYIDFESINVKIFNELSAKNLASKVINSIILENEEMFQSLECLRNAQKELETDSGMIKLNEKLTAGLQGTKIRPKSLEINCITDILTIDCGNDQELKYLFLNLVLIENETKHVIINFNGKSDNIFDFWFEKMKTKFDFSVIFDVKENKMELSEFYFLKNKSIRQDICEVLSVEEYLYAFFVNEMQFQKFLSPYFSKITDEIQKIDGSTLFKLTKNYNFLETQNA